MRVLALEYQYSGHHLEHLSYLLGPLLRSGSRVTVALTREALESPQYREYIAPFAGAVEFDEGLRAIGAGRLHAPRAVHIFREFCRAVERHKPDRVLLPSADVMTFGALAGVPRSAASAIARAPIDVCLHSGPGGMRDESVGQRARAWLMPFALRRAPWARIRFLNPLVVDAMKARAAGSRLQLSCMPNPVPVSRGLDRHQSRERLGLPTSGRYLCATGGLGLSWKGTDRLLEAFRRMRRRPTDRLLLAGASGPKVRALIAARYQGLINEQRLLTLDRFLSSHDIDAVCTAADVVCVPYPKFARVSGVLLRGVAAGRPVVSTDTGWCGEVVRRFGLGTTCDATDLNVLVASLERALDIEGERFAHPLAALFMRYHSIGNFVAHWLGEPSACQGGDAGEFPYTWPQLLADGSRLRAEARLGPMPA